LVAEERAALEDFDIPRFTIGVHEVGLFSADALPVEGYFTTSGFSMVSSRFARMGEHELRRQVDLLRDALSASIDSRLGRAWAPSATRAAETRGNALGPYLERCAIWIGKELLDRAQDAGNGGLRWRFPDHERERSEIETRFGLYDGSVGVGLFFAALGAVTGDEEWSEAARRAIVDLEGIVETNAIDSITGEGHLGACAGVGSIVYATCWMAHLLADDALLELAIRVAGLITEERIRRDRHLDVMGGAAGALLTLLALHRHSGDNRALALASLCGKHLVAMRKDTGQGGAAWQVRGGHPLAGFAHGAAGIAYALTRLFVVTGEHALRETASAAYRYERSLYSETRANWPVVEEPDDGGGQRFLNAWCHGAPGVGLGRVLALDVLDDDDVRSEIEVAIAAAARAKSTGADHLCCGNLGRADILLALGQRLGKQDLVSLAEDLVREVVAKAVDRGYFVLPSSIYEHRVFAPGFFRGLSGVGYGLLRAAAPSRLPTILGVEADVPVHNGTPPGKQA
jgi:type 2 lantibiotic biosynthesis protein LanM